MARFWAMFYLISLGLGYPTLNRYDPSKIPGTADAIEYRHTVLADTPADDHVRYRLVPYLARPIYHLATGKVGTWDPVWLSMLVVNSAFVAGSAVLLIFLSNLLLLSRPAGLISAMAYFLNFNMANDQLAGLVDSSEAFAVLVLLLVLVKQRWVALPMVFAVGVLFKETFLPIASLFTFGWIWREQHRPWKHLGLAVAAGLIVLLLVPFLVTAHFVSPTQTIAEYGAMTLRSFVSPFLAWTLWLTFLWPLPFAFRGMKRLPRGLFFATSAAAIGIYLLGSFADMGASISRPLFSAAGPCLCLAFAAGVTESAATT